MNFKVKTHLIIFVLALLLYSNFVYLVPNSFSVFSLSLKDISGIVFLLLPFSLCIKYRENIFKNRLFIFVELFTVLLVLTSSFQANYIYHQPFILGLRAQRDLIFLPFFFLYFGSLIKKKAVKKNDIIKVVYFFAIVQLILCSLQFLLADRFVFMNVAIRFRNGHIRIRTDIDIILLAYYMSLNNVINNKKILKNSIFCGYVIYYVLYIYQTRMSLTVIVMVSIVISIFISKITINKKIMLLVPILLISFVFYNSDIGKNILNIIFNDQSDSSQSIREIGRTFYISTIKENPVFGGGFVNILWPESAQNSMYNQGVYYNDNGIFGFMFYYGLIGIVYILLIYLYILKRSIYYLKCEHNISYFGFAAHTLLRCYTIFSLGMSANICLPILLILIDDDKKGVLR